MVFGWLEVGEMAVSVRNRSMLASRWRRHCSRVRAGGCLLFAPGTRRTSDIQPRDPLLQFRDVCVLVLQQHPLPLDCVPQPRILAAQLSRITRQTGSPERIGHPGTTSEPALRKQPDTPGRPAEFRAPS